MGEVRRRRQKSHPGKNPGELPQRPVRRASQAAQFSAASANKPLISNRRRVRLQALRGGFVFRISTQSKTSTPAQRLTALAQAIDFSYTRPFIPKHLKGGKSWATTRSSRLPAS